MIIHNDTRPLVALALFVLVCMVLLGLLLAGTELPNPGRSGGEATRMAHDNDATESVFSATKTKRAGESEQMSTKSARSIEVSETGRAVEIEQTAIPHMRTATALVVEVTMDASRANATQAALEVKIQSERTSLNATATALASSQERVRQRDSNDTIAGTIVLAGTGALFAASTVLVLSLAKWLNSRARTIEIESIARLHIERRRTIELEAAVRKAPRPVQPTFILPNSKSGSHEQSKIQ